MKVIISRENYLEFDNGLKVYGEHHQDCCENNYLDFEQLQVGDEFEDVESPVEFLAIIKIKEDGFSIKDKTGVPKWVQARSEQNGYYSSSIDLVVERGGEKYMLTKPKIGEELFDECWGQT